MKRAMSDFPVLLTRCVPSSFAWQNFPRKYAVAFRQFPCLRADLRWRGRKPWAFDIQRKCSRCCVGPVFWKAIRMMGRSTALYRFRYSIERDSLRQTLTDEVRFGLHQRLAEWLDAMAPRAPHWLAEQAAHLCLCGREAEAVKSYERLSEVAMSRRSVGDALRCIEIARVWAQCPDEQVRLEERARELEAELTPWKGGVQIVSGSTEEP